MKPEWEAQLAEIGGWTAKDIDWELPKPEAIEAARQWLLGLDHSAYVCIYSSKDGGVNVELVTHGLDLWVEFQNGGEVDIGGIIASEHMRKRMHDATLPTARASR